jgi:hypothetical protein
MGKHQIKLSTAALLLLPVMLLAGLAISLRGKPGAVITMPYGTFNLVVSEVKFKEVPPQQGEQRIEITVYVTYEGTEPKWWTKDGNSKWLQSMRFVNHKGKKYPLYSFGGGPAPYNEAQQSHVLQYTCSVPNGYDITKSGYFKGTVMIANQMVPLKPLGIARFSVPVRVE